MTFGLKPAIADYWLITSLSDLGTNGSWASDNTNSGSASKCVCKTTTNDSCSSSTSRDLSSTGGIIKPRWIFSWSAWIWTLVVISRLSSTRETVVRFGEARCTSQIRELLTDSQFLLSLSRLSIAWSACKRRWRDSSKNTFPASVSWMRRLVRWNRHPNSASLVNLLTKRLLSHVAVLAARPKCSSSATITKYRGASVPFECFKLIVYEKSVGQWNDCSYDRS